MAKKIEFVVMWLLMLGAEAIKAGTKREFDIDDPQTQAWVDMGLLVPVEEQLDLGGKGEGGGEDDPVDIEKIVEAISSLDGKDPELWTSDNSPKVTAIEAALGYQITAEQRDQAWAMLLESGND